jgi:hypothetical protein
MALQIFVWNKGNNQTNKSWNPRSDEIDCPVALPECRAVNVNDPCDDHENTGEDLERRHVDGTP